MRIGPGRVQLGIDRGEYWQIAAVIPKGGYRDVQSAGLPAFRASVARLAPEFTDRVAQIGSWDDVKVLSVRVDRLRRWYAPGVLLIGDAAHAMSPIGGVGINLAVQDAVAAARILAEPIRARRLNSRVLAKVQARRRFPTVGTPGLAGCAATGGAGHGAHGRRPGHRAAAVEGLATVPCVAGHSGPGGRGGVAAGAIGQ